MVTIVRKSTIATWQSQLAELTAENMNLKAENARMKLDRTSILKEVMNKNANLLWENCKLKTELAQSQKKMKEMAEATHQMTAEFWTEHKRLTEKAEQAKKQYMLLEMHLYEYVRNRIEEGIAEKNKEPVKLVVNCDICAEPYASEPVARTPRVLGCGHSMCLDCMRRSASGDWISCCFCRRATHFPGLGADGLAKNFALLQIMSNSAG